MSYETAAFRASPSLSKILSFQRGGDPPNRCDQVRPDRYTASILRVLRPARGGDCSVHIEKGLCRDTRYSLATTLRHGERACPFSPVFLGQDLRMLLSAARILKSVSTVLRNGEAAHRRCRPLPVCMHRQRKERAPTLGGWVGEPKCHTKQPPSGRPLLFQKSFLFKEAGIPRTDAIK